MNQRHLKSDNTETRLRNGRSGVRIRVGEIDFSFLQNVQTRSEADTASYSVGTGVLSPGKAAGS